MADSLRDQLVKAGLATSAQAKKAERSGRAVETAKRHDKAKDKTKGKDESTSQTQQVKAKATQQRAEKAARDKAIAQVRNAKSEAKAI